MCKEWETFAADEHVYRPFPSVPVAIDRTLETMKRVRWLEIGPRHLVWMARQALRLAGHPHPLGLRPHDGVAAVAAGAGDRDGAALNEEDLIRIISKSLFAH